MSRPARRLRTAAAALVAALASHQGARAQSLQDFHLGSWQGSLGLGWSTERESLGGSPGGQPVDFSRQREHERLNVENYGFYFIDPQLVTGNLGVDFDLVQTHESGAGPSEGRRSRLVGYSFDSTLLSALPYNGRIYANQAQNQLIQPFGHTDLTLENRGAVARLREDSPLRDLGLPFLSGELSLEQQHSQETTTSVLGQSFHSDQRQDTLAAAVHKGYLTADLDAHYQVIDVTDAQFANLTFRSTAANLAHSLDFGSALNRHLDSRLYHYDRNGLTPITIDSVDESLRVDLQQNLGGGGRYVWNRTDVHNQASGGNDRTATRNGELFLHYEPWQAFYLDNQVSAIHQDLPTGQRDTRSGQASVQYRHAVLEDGTANARAVLRYQVDDNRLDASQVQVIDEAQSAPALLGAGAGFDLGQPFASAASIVVVDARGGSRLPTTLGVDYDIVSNGNQTRIVPLPTSAVIRPGDPLLVSYVYQLDPSIRYSTASQSFSLGLDLPWLALSYGHDQSAQHLLSGVQASYLEDLRKDSAQLELRRDWDDWHSQADLGLVRYQATQLAYRQQRAGGLLSWRPRLSTTLSLSADRTATDFGMPVHRTISTSARFSLDWFPPGTWPVWAVTGLLGHRVYQDTLQPTETIDDASVKMRMTLGKLDFSSSLVASERRIDGFSARNYGLELAAVRRF